eukprot:maker-scaffold_69-snap-gene-0.45-mRNA-1 protein AED:0.00 eAED:0.00 QI:3/1/1/1/1/1/2/106/458
MAYSDTAITVKCRLKQNREMTDKLKELNENFEHVRNELRQNIQHAAEDIKHAGEDIKEQLTLWQAAVRLAFSRIRSYLGVLPTFLEFVGVIFVIYIIRAIVKHDDRIKHSALLRVGKYRVSLEREKPRDYHALKYFQNQQGLWIHYSVWPNKNFTKLSRDRSESDLKLSTSMTTSEFDGSKYFPKGVILIFHGHSEHVNRHAHVAEYMAKNNYLVFGIDHQGFGRSEGDRGHVESFEHYLDDVVLFLSEVMPDLPIIEEMEKFGLNFKSLPVFFLSHSMGSLISLTTGLRLQLQNHKLLRRLKGLIVGSPPLYLDPRTRKPWLMFLMHLAAYIFPKFPLIGFPPEESTSFSQVKFHSQFDPLNYQDKIRPHQLAQMLGKNKYLLDHAEDFNLPIFLFHGTDDPTCNIVGSRQFIERIPSKDKTLLELPGLKHEPMQEQRAIREELFAKIVSWINKRVK